MAGMRRSLAGVVVLVLASLALLAPAAWAHAPAPPQAAPAPVSTAAALEDAQTVLDTALAAGAPAASVLSPWIVAALLGAGAAGFALGPRRAVALGTALLLAGLAFDAGLHSVHHLGDEVGEAACLVASAAAINAVAAEAPDAQTPVLVPTGRIAPLSELALDRRLSADRPVRAPPSA